MAQREMLERGKSSQLSVGVYASQEMGEDVDMVAQVRGCRHGGKSGLSRMGVTCWNLHGKFPMLRYLHAAAIQRM